MPRRLPWGRASTLKRRLNLPSAYEEIMIELLKNKPEWMKRREAIINKPIKPRSRNGVVVSLDTPSSYSRVKGVKGTKAKRRAAKEMQNCIHGQSEGYRLACSIKASVPTRLGRR